MATIVFSPSQIGPSEVGNASPFFDKKRPRENTPQEHSKKVICSSGSNIESWKENISPLEANKYSRPEDRKVIEEALKALFPNVENTDPTWNPDPSPQNLAQAATWRNQYPSQGEPSLDDWL